MGAPDAGSSLDQARGRGPRGAARWALADCRRMTERLMVSLHGSSVQRGGKWVLNDVNWTLRPGERWALIGDNGAGKTQLLKLLSGDVWPTPRAGKGRPRGGESRRYRAGRQPADLIEAKRRIAYIGAEQQDKYARYGWNLRVRDLVATGLHRTDLLLQPATPAEVKLVAATLRTCGLSRLAAREFLSLSYGQKRLALLARALVQDPDWLLLDEFYNGLDAHYRRRIEAGCRTPARPGLGRDGSPCDGCAPRHAWNPRTPRRPGARHQAPAAGGPREAGRAGARASATCGARARRTEAQGGRSRGSGSGAGAVDQGRPFRRIPPGAQGSELAAAQGRAVGDLRRERRRKIQFPQAAVRRSVALPSAGEFSARAFPPALRSRIGSGRWAMCRRNCRATMR